MVIIDKVTKVYNKKFKAVDELSLEINDGEIFGILGPNGSGKTTTLKMLTGSLSITEGNIKINGYDITQNSVEAKKEFGFVPDSPDIFLKLSGMEYLHFLATVYGLDKDYAKDRIELLSNKFDMKEDLLSSENYLRLANNDTEDLTIKKLTRGNPTMKQKFEEARAIADENLIGSGEN